MCTDTYFSFRSYLYIARANDPTIVRYDPSAQSIMEFNIAGSAQSISVDGYNNVIYWARFDENIHRVMRTLLNGDTVDLNITYSGEIDLTLDVFNFYVLDQENGRIDKYLKASLVKQGNITYHGQIHDLIIANGEYVLSSISMNSDIGTDQAEPLGVIWRAQVYNAKVLA